jgi:hypothetical protein
MRGAAVAVQYFRRVEARAELDGHEGEHEDERAGEQAEGRRRAPTVGRRAR